MNNDSKIGKLYDEKAEYALIKVEQHKKLNFIFQITITFSSKQFQT